jgi:hypothetical protein
MVRTIPIILEEGEFQKASARKRKLGMTWKEFVLTR